MSIHKGTGYRATLGAAVLIGGSAVVGLFCGLIRGKVVAVWLGPVGMGLLGAYQSIVELFVMIFSIGIGTSGVRIIAEAAGRGGDVSVSQVAWVIRRLAWGLGMLGAICLILLSKQIGLWTFGVAGDYHGLALLGLAVLGGALALGCTTIIQATRHMAQLASIGVWGSIFGVLIGVPVVIWGGMPGIVWLPIITALSGAVLATVAFRRLHLPPVVRQEVAVMPILSPLMSIGLLFTINSIASSLLGWIIRTYVIRSFGLDVGGYFQVALNLSNIYVGIVLQAMSADYFPRIASISTGARDVNESINEQLVTTVLLAAPGIVATLVMAPLVIELFYAHSFMPAVGVLRWYLLGALVRVMAWPFSMALYARGAMRMIFLADGAFYLVNLLLLVPASMKFGLNGVGMAFFVASCINCVVAFCVSQRIFSFQFMGIAKRYVITVISLVGASLSCMVLLPPGYKTVLGVLIAMVAALHSLYAFAELIPAGRLESVACKVGFNMYRQWKSKIRKDGKPRGGSHA
ncbi:MAG: oligosaccharide flippase family protein [bacterium]